MVGYWPLDLDLLTCNFSAPALVWSYYIYYCIKSSAWWLKPSWWHDFLTFSWPFWQLISQEAPPLLQWPACNSVLIAPFLFGGEAGSCLQRKRKLLGFTLSNFERGPVDWDGSLLSLLTVVPGLFDRNAWCWMTCCAIVNLHQSKKKGFMMMFEGWPDKHVYSKIWVLPNKHDQTSMHSSRQIMSNCLTILRPKIKFAWRNLCNRSPLMAGDGFD